VLAEGVTVAVRVIVVPTIIAVADAESAVVDEAGSGDEGSPEAFELLPHPVVKRLTFINKRRRAKNF
jgi:hypothetical protein